MPGDVLVLPTVPRPVKQGPVVESEVVAMVILIFTEVMLFGGFLSAYTIISTGSTLGAWPPPTDPALPAVSTGVATAALMLSGVAMLVAGRSASPVAALLASAGLAAGFVGWQVIEFVQLIRQGLTLVSSAHGGFFYTIVGAHALHAIVAIGVLLWAIGRQRRGELSAPLFLAVRMFWYFVVLLWPVLYAVVYL